jgi:glutathione synthase/RimK-type ligase-like ATP-grasp enzyme
MTVSNGIYSMYHNPEYGVKNLARNVAQTLEADFIAVDIMEMNGKPLLQEISLHPGFKAYETKIKGEPVNIAEAIITAFSD